MPGVPISDVEKMVQECKLLRDKAILYCLVDCGCRAQEFTNLNINDVDLIQGIIRVRNGKGGKSRTTYLGNKSRKLLRQYLNQRDDKNNALWLNEDGDRLRFEGLRQILIRRAKDANVPIPGPHDFRRCCGKELHKNHVDILTISRILGHSSLEVTKRYIALDDTDILDAYRRGSPVDNGK